MFGTIEVETFFPSLYWRNRLDDAMFFRKSESSIFHLVRVSLSIVLMWEETCFRLMISTWCEIDFSFTFPLMRFIIDEWTARRERLDFLRDFQSKNHFRTQKLKTRTLIKSQMKSSALFKKLEIFLSANIRLSLPEFLTKFKDPSASLAINFPSRKSH